MVAQGMGVPWATTWPTHMVKFVQGTKAFAMYCHVPIPARARIIILCWQKLNNVQTSSLCPHLPTAPLLKFFSRTSFLCSVFWTLFLLPLSAFVKNAGILFTELSFVVLSSWLIRCCHSPPRAQVSFGCSKVSVGSFSINGLTSPKWATLIWVLNSLCTSLSPLCTEFFVHLSLPFVPNSNVQNVTNSDESLPILIHMHQKFKLAYQGPSNSLIVFSLWFYFCECKWIISMIIFQVLYFSWVVGLGTMKGLVTMVDG